jgi:hypothetical protein
MQMPKNCWPAFDLNRTTSPKAKTVNVIVEGSGTGSIPAWKPSVTCPTGNCCMAGADDSSFARAARMVSVMAVPLNDRLGLIERDTVGEFTGVKVNEVSKTVVLSTPSGAGESGVSDVPSVLCQRENPIGCWCLSEFLFAI